MEYFFYCRDKPGSGPLRESLGEAHWSFMDAYAAGMVARGPTLAEDGLTATGSVHIVDLADTAAARTFAYEEPNYKAGVYSEVMVRRWLNALGRTMWEFQGGSDATRFLVIGHAKPGARLSGEAWAAAHRDDMVKRGYWERLIACGPFLSDDGADWVGDASMIELESRPDVEAMLAGEPEGHAGLYEHREVHLWTFGGRR